MRGSRGIAQLLVLWALVLLGTLAMGFSLSMRTEAQAARNGVDDARAYYQARTGVQRAVMLLSTASPDNVMRMKIEGEDGDLSYRVRVVSESGKVDVNFVSEDDLLEILKKGGLPDDEAESLRDAIEDWRDKDDDPRRRGGEYPDYAQLPEALQPRNGNLRGVGELRYVKGVTPVFYDRFLSQVFTTHGNSPQVNVLHAPEIVLQSLPGVSPEAVAEILARRGQDPPVSPADLAAMSGGGMLTPKGLAMVSGREATKVYEITATGRAGKGVLHTVRCLAEVGGVGKNQVKILGWLDLAPREEEG
jgi:general secretion pathway protein K